MIERFLDQTHGRRRIVECLLGQNLVANNNGFAEDLVDVIELRELSPGEVLINQDWEDSDLYFILVGLFSVNINSREVAIRQSGDHVGEMALIDPTAKRSATVIAKEVSVVAVVDEGSFSELGKKYPEAWRRIAVELAHRLRERSKFVKRPNSKPMIFIGSSAENSEVANKIKECICDEDVEIRVWSEPGIFELTKSALDSLIETARAYDFCIMIFDENDITESRAGHYFAPRDNVVFELGLFLGAIGAERSYVLRPKSTDLKIPSDLFGITMLVWEPSDLDSSIKVQCALVKQAISKLGPK